MREILKALTVIVLLAYVAPASWEKQPTVSLAWFRTIHFADANNGWIGGSKGTLIVTRDGGKSWRPARKIHFGYHQKDIF